MRRLRYYFIIRTFLFGPVGNSKHIFYFVHALYWLYQYPTYLNIVAPFTWDTYTELNVCYLASHVLMWIFFYMTHLTGPGYLEQNTREYQHVLRQVSSKTPPTDLFNL